MRSPTYNSDLGKLTSEIMVSELILVNFGFHLINLLTFVRETGHNVPNRKGSNLSCFVA